MTPADLRKIPRSDHSISRSSLSPNAVRVLYRLHDNGFISYLVGGCVRDLLLGREPKDFDIVTNATPGQIKKLFRNCRLIGRRFRLAHLHFQNEILEVATFRSVHAEETREEPPAAAVDAQPPVTLDLRHQPRHMKSTEGMILRDNVFGSPEEDANRRDFTVNALFYNIADFSLIDHVGGLNDLRQGIIRTIGNPAERFIEDPVRMIRAVRFAAMLGFSIEAATMSAIVELNATITRAAPPRLFEEILKLFLSGEGAKTYQLLRQTGLFAPLFPHFSNWLTSEAGGFPHTRIGEALEWVDARVGEGEKIPAHFLFSLMFGQYIEEKSARFRKDGAPWQQSVDSAVAEFLGELAPTVFIPHKIGVMMRNIFILQRRFLKMPGKQPAHFLGRPGFGEALDYLNFLSQSSRESTVLHGWWKNFVEENPPLPTDEQPTGQEPHTSAEPRRRRRRRRRRFEKTNKSP